MSLVRWQEPNLARAPFVNERPVRRLAVLLWLLFVLVGAIGVWQSRSSREETGARVAEVARLNRETVSARERAANLERDLQSADLPAQNERTSFLNRRLDERAFSWSTLLESLTQAMPRGVRLMRLSPEGFASERKGGSGPPKSASTSRVALRISGEAEETEAVLEFVDRLFQHPAFDRPNLSRESEKKDFKVQFELAVAYLPEVAVRLAGGGVAEVTPPVGGRTGLPADSRGPSAPRSSTVADEPTVGAAAAGKGAATIDRRPASAAQNFAAAGRSLRAGASDSPSSSGRSAAAEMRSEPDPGATEDGASPRSGRGDGSFSVPVVPGAGVGGFRPEATAPSAVPAPTSSPGAGEAPFPGNVMPTPLRPYASSTGGGR